MAGERSRLRSAANYRPFHPQAIACSPPTFSTGQNSSANSSVGQHETSADFSSIGALAGDDGISLFRTSRPNAPLLVLSHSSMESSRIQNLAFEPGMLLAASRGNGLLLWDASGHSLSPLLGRLAVEDSNSTTNLNDVICSIAWKSSDTICMSNASYTSLWDLRSSLGSKTSQPAVRFGHTAANAVSLIQVACSDEHCATMDASGLVRVYDLRMTGSNNNNSMKPRVLTHFPAFYHAGIGLSSFQTSSDETYWMTWGLDAPKSDAVVKLWSTTATTKEEVETAAVDSDTYWHMDGADHRSSLQQSSQVKSTQVAQFTMPNLACARVCPAPYFENSIVTVGPSSRGGGGFKAELWKLTVDDDEEASETTDTFGVEKVLSFVQDLSELNDTSIGPLRGAELALCQDGDWELLLCCMSEDGFVTTSAITEAPNLDGTSTTRGGGVSNLRFFPQERRLSSTVDAASALKSIGDSGHGRHPLDDSRHGYGGLSSSQHQPSSQHASSLSSFHQNHHHQQQPHPESPVKTSADRSLDISDSKYIPSTRSGDGGDGMPFDMDNVGLLIAPSPMMIEPSSVATITGAETDAKRGTKKRVTSDRVPCPRLCGATFSPGAGGLICFNNGEIHKMWSWYQKNESRRKSSGQLRSSPDLSLNNTLKYPRLKKDLDDMTKAAKDAQWGENSDDDDQEQDTNESEESIDDLFEDLSSEEEGDAAMIEVIHAQSQEAVDGDIYETYFGSHEKPVALPTATAPPKVIEGDASNNNGRPTDEVLQTERQRQRQSILFDGPSSDVLAPIVHITYDTSARIFNGQSVELAEQLILGDWKGVIQEEKPDDRSMSDGSLMEPSPIAEGADKDTPYWSPTRISPHGRFVPSGAFTPPRRDIAMPTRLSDPMLNMRGVVPPSQTAMQNEDDAPVHGGEYAVRPKRDESMVILRKLLPTPYQSLLSPPDSHLLPNKLDKAAHMKRSSSSNAIMQTVRATLAASQGNIRPPSSSGGVTPILSPLKFGVYTMAAHEEEVVQSTRNEVLKLICHHNSNVCRDNGQDEKANTWSMLAQAVDNNSLDDEASDSCDGWGGPALGRELVKNMLAYYEAQGDVQMVASMVCVLSAGQRDSCSLLSTENNAKHDLYIQRYAELVYRWGLLTKRVELHKHLSRHLPLPEGAQILARRSSSNLDEEGDKRFGISIAVSCPRCSSSGTVTNNICSKCHDYAFRCSICDNAVRGMFTVCALCGHGGHLDHIMQWFGQHTKCPTGCGCTCVLATTAPSVVTTSPSVVDEEPELLALQRMPFVAF